MRKYSMIKMFIIQIIHLLIRKNRLNLATSQCKNFGYFLSIFYPWAGFRMPQTIVWDCFFITFCYHTFVYLKKLCEWGKINVSVCSVSNSDLFVIENLEKLPRRFYISEYWMFYREPGFLSYDRIEVPKDKTIDHNGELYTRRVGKEMSSVSADQ